MKNKEQNLKALKVVFLLNYKFNFKSFHIYGLARRRTLFGNREGEGGNWAIAFPCFTFFKLDVSDRHGSQHTAVHTGHTVSRAAL